MGFRNELHCSMTRLLVRPAPARGRRVATTGRKGGGESGRAGRLSFWGAGAVSRFCETNPTSGAASGFCETNPTSGAASGFCETNPTSGAASEFCETNSCARCRAGLCGRCGLRHQNQPSYSIKVVRSCRCLNLVTGFHRRRIHSDDGNTSLKSICWAHRIDRCSSSAVTWPAELERGRVPVASLRNSTLNPR